MEIWLMSKCVAKEDDKALSYDMSLTDARLHSIHPDNTIPIRFKELGGDAQHMIEGGNVEKITAVVQASGCLQDANCIDNSPAQESAMTSIVKKQELKNC